MPHQGILTKLFPSMSMRLQDNRVRGKVFLRELPAAAWTEKRPRDASTCAYPAFAGTRAPLSMTSSKRFLRKAFTITVGCCSFQTDPLQNSERPEIA
jgi:hypothetical protein